MITRSKFSLSAFTRVSKSGVAIRLSGACTSVPIGMNQIFGTFVSYIASSSMHCPLRICASPYPAPLS